MIAFLVLLTASIAVVAVAQPGERVTECVILGDPHLYQFDAVKYAPKDSIYVGTSCTYMLARTDCKKEDTLPKFWAIGSFSKDDITKKPTSVHQVEAFMQLSTWNWGVRISRGLEIKVWTETDTTSPSMTLTVATLLNSPYIYSGNVIRAVYANDNPTWGFRGGATVIVVDFTNGMQVMYDGEKMVRIHAPKSLFGKLCGLCGNGDGDSSNDQVIGPVYTGSAACQDLCNGSPYDLDYEYMNMAGNTEDFINSWYTGGVDSNPTCAKEWGKP